MYFEEIVEKLLKKWGNFKTFWRKFLKNANEILEVALRELTRENFQIILKN